ncbi:DUF2177 family protein [Candidatus Parcubacteria bacterium]|nr:MAG: DUF2177 family protein [Candidatus Parcubacteria bacterium]
MIKYFISYIGALVSLFVLDGLWLKVIAKDFYQKNLGFLFSSQINWLPILIFYPLYALGIFFFVLKPSFEGVSLWQVFMRGAFFGLIAYAAYDLTNHATIKDWPALVTFVDMGWGALITAIASVVAILLAGLL